MVFWYLVIAIVVFGIVAYIYDAGDFYSDTLEFFAAPVFCILVFVTLVVGILELTFISNRSITIDNLSIWQSEIYLFYDDHKEDIEYTTIINDKIKEYNDELDYYVTIGKALKMNYSSFLSYPIYNFNLRTLELEEVYYDK